MTRSLSFRLTQMNMLVSGSALLLAGLAFAAHDLITFRGTIARNLSAQAQIIETNSVSALLFNDVRSAEQTLAALEAAPEIISARIFDAEGRPFAEYRRNAAGELPPPLAIPAGQQETSALATDSVSLARRIVLDGRPAGVVSIRSDIDAMYVRLARYGAIVAAVLLISGIGALLASVLAQRAVAAPLGAIAALAQRVSEEKDYSVRAEVPTAASELAVLARSFNEMLAQIQTQDASLQRARDELEDRVRQRTTELNALNQELEAFSYSVSHDLRAPLRHVTGFASLLERHAGPALDAQGRRYLQTITDAAARMGMLIDDLLAFSRAGRAQLSKRRVELSDVFREARAEVAAEVNGRRIAWDVGPLPAVDADPALLRPALVNLLSNAVKYTSTREEARIEVGALGPAQEEVIVYVRDNGVGFDMAYAHKLFGVFQRLHRSDEFAGTGIGLANVRRIVQRHGGRTWAEGELDRGATFYFSLPVSDAGGPGAET